MQQAAQTSIAAVMRPPTYTVTAQEPVQELLALFIEKGISAAPVIDAQGSPVGFVSKTDVVREVRRSGADAHHDSGPAVQPWWDTTRLAHLQVGQIMTPTVYTFPSDTTVADAIAVMAFEGIHHLPVVDAAGALVGMLSALDILDWLARSAGYTPAGGQAGHIFKRPS
ncbi:MAG: HPP family protein [Candidatus Tectimicrobiota bacterium]